jgi:hypothetical protein
MVTHRACAPEMPGAAARGCLTNREFRHRACVLLAFGAWQRRANERTMDGAFVGGGETFVLRSLF